MITRLKPGECFVMGSNASGFHGAGSAGFAWRGTNDTNWRGDVNFNAALNELNKKKKNLNYNKNLLIGKWAVLGENGLMEGKEGKSYGIITTERPGNQGIVDLNYVKRELVKLFRTAKENKELSFLCVNFGLSRKHGGFSWFNPDELRKVWREVEETEGKVKNLKGPDWSKENLDQRLGI